MPGVRRFSFVLGALTVCTLWVSVPPTTHAQTIDLSLNVFYTNPANQNSGGTWELVGKSSNFGIAGIDARIANIAGGVNRGPRGIVNGNDLAGFSIFADVPISGGRNIIAGQAPLAPLGAGEEQSVFYGVGTLQNGAPNYPGKPAGSNSIGPPFNSLTSVTEVPWALNVPLNTGDWATAARLASGTFAPSVTPAFLTGSSGTVFTTLPPTNTQFGNIASATLTTIVRTNFSTLTADYNANGVVDAADYVLWRNANGTSVTPGTSPDGTGDGFVNIADYDFWRSRFGLPAGSGSGVGSSTNAIPEPSTFVLVAFGALAFSLAFRRHSRLPVSF
jgi:hypothetical protein